MFSTLGATPTGLTAIDLNSPEDEPRLYGPYPVLRFVTGLEGNAAFLVPSARNGILLHTGNWSAAAGWAPPAPMPNSEGCVHTWPDHLRAMWRALVDRGVAVRPNTNGRLPYPYRPQGLAAVYRVHDNYGPYDDYRSAS